MITCTLNYYNIFNRFYILLSIENYLKQSFITGYVKKNPYIPVVSLYTLKVQIGLFGIFIRFLDTSLGFTDLATFDVMIQLVLLLIIQVHISFHVRDSHRKVANYKMKSLLICAFVLYAGKFFYVNI